MKDDEQEVMEKALRLTKLGHVFSRREFLLVSGAMVVAVSALEAWGAQEAPLVIMDQAKGLIIADPTKCVGCRRCELACSEFNDGKASPTIARIKVSRNLNFGPKSLHARQSGLGTWGNGLVIQDVCNQCPHPVPCANACPNNAIVVAPQTNARVVDPHKCIGCKMCQRACPWEMMSFDSDTNKATKCFLCDGNPKCVSACPAEALSYVAWRDLTDTVPPRAVPTAVVSPDKVNTCSDCHTK
jgi:Fe-S-cluster-containing dehydrogenase component